MFAEAEKQNEVNWTFGERTSENVGGMNCLSKKWLKLACLKSKEKLFEKDVDRGLELAETLTEKRTREYKARTSKAESDASILNRKCEVEWWINKI